MPRANRVGLQPATAIFTIPDVTKRGSIYAPIDESGNVTKHECHQNGEVWRSMLFRATFVAAAITVATIGAASIAESAAASAITPVLTTSCLPGDYVLPLAIHCRNPPTKQPGDTYQCRDGCFSDSKTSQGACSHHGGIDHRVNSGNG
jgi:hypothetical protein